MKRIAAAALVGAVLVVVAAVAASYVVYQRVGEPYRGFGGPERFVDLPPGTTTAEIGKRLVDAGVVRDSLTFRLALWRTGVARRLQAGEYRFDRPMSAEAVLHKIARGEVHLRPITFPEGLTIAEMAAVFELAGFGKASEFAEAARRAELVKDLDPRATDLEGYLFPETYRLGRHTSASDLVGMMVARFRQVLTADLVEESSAAGFDVRELVTLASLVEKETGRADERTLVAAVYRNRLRIHMGLQCDPTVIYALQRAGKWDGNLTREDLSFDSPYNTYRYSGLPPGPIAAPGRDSLIAAARPAAVDYLYFVSRNDGSHEFAESLAEHNRNVLRYQIRYFRDKRRGQTR
ncbi:MAG: endolytic transglycosylase MltG [Vicinamibacterales bacterium]